MGTLASGGTRHLHHPGESRVHRLPAEAKIVATFVFVLTVVLTPREVEWAFALHLTLVLAAARGAALPVRFVIRRLRLELPFLAFAVFLPLVGPSPRTDVAGIALSEPGLWAAWNLVAKGTLGVLAAIVLAGSTPTDELLRGLERLRMPRAITAIAGFMVRYLDIIVSDAERMRIARASRGYDPRWLWQVRAIASSTGSLFVRCYERGERVHLAMLSRGYSGAMPQLHHHHSTAAEWAAASVVPVGAVGVMLWARVLG